MKAVVLALVGCAAKATHPVPVAPKAAPPPPPPDVAVRLDITRPPPPTAAPAAPLLEIMTTELKRSMAELGKHPEPPYFASYEATDTHTVSVSASFGALDHSSDSHYRALDIDVRVGDYKLDNTHGATRGHTESTTLPFEDDPVAIRTMLWMDTDTAYKHAAEALTKVQASTKIRVAAEDDSDDFSHETTGAELLEAPATIAIDRTAWEQRLRNLSAEFKKYPELASGNVALNANAVTHYYVSSAGTRYQVPGNQTRITITATAIVADGMQLRRSEWFDIARETELPTDAQIRAKIATVARDVVALRAAPVAEPYLGPAILEGKAAGVFFHEVFGHRIEGHRQKEEAEGQTFAKKIGQPIMPAFIDVYDDPTIGTLDGVALNGFYRYDDEGMPAQRASLVEKGVLRTFLLGRSPARGFTHSNGHGRRSAGYSVVARQGNLVVAPSRTVDPKTLRAMLLAEVKAQGKPYGIVFRELDGGFTMTTRFEPQSFKLLPVMMVRVYPDGREELVRGSDLEGTPLRALADIVAAGDDVATFNGYCGAESGFVPVSATSPSLLVAHIEIAKKAKSQDKPPILPAPEAAR